jgi:hypothetical protein
MKEKRIHHRVTESTERKPNTEKEKIIFFTPWFPRSAWEPGDLLSRPARSVVLGKSVQ